MSNEVDANPITKAFLEKALSKEGVHADHELLSFDVKYGTKPGDNFLSVIYSVELNLKPPNSNETFKRYWFVKCYPEHPGRQEFTNRSNLFFKELEAYSKWIPELQRLQKEVLKLPESQQIKLPYAHFVYGECIDFQSEYVKERVNGPVGTLDNYLILEDMRKTYGYRMTEKLLPMDTMHVNLAIKSIAKIHALGLAYKHHVCEDVTIKFPCLKPNWEKTDRDMFKTVSIGNFQELFNAVKAQLGSENEVCKGIRRMETYLDIFMESFSGNLDEIVFADFCRLPPDPLKFPRGINMPDDVLNTEVPWKIVSHGDCWSNNLLYSYDEKTGLPTDNILIDLQMLNESSPTFDLEYVIHTGPDSPTRKRELDNWLLLYFNWFKGYCNVLKTPLPPQFTLQELRYRFHRTRALGFFMGSMIFPLKYQENCVNLESFDKDINAEEMFSTLARNGVSDLGRKIMTEFCQELYNEGIL